MGLRTRILNAQAHKLPPQSRLLRLVKFWKDCRTSDELIEEDIKNEFGKKATFNSVFMDCITQDNRVGDCYLRVYESSTGYLVCIKGEWFEMNDQPNAPNGVNMCSDDWSDEALKRAKCKRMTLDKCNPELRRAIFQRMVDVEEGY